MQEWAFGKWKLVVEVSEAMTSRHTSVIERIHKAMRQRPSMDKEDAFANAKIDSGQVLCLTLLWEQTVDSLGSYEAVGSDASCGIGQWTMMRHWAVMRPWAVMRH